MKSITVELPEGGLYIVTLDEIYVYIRNRHNFIPSKFAEPAQINTEKIIKELTGHLGVTMEQICGDGKKKTESEARHMLVFMLGTYGGKKDWQIAEIIGRLRSTICSMKLKAIRRLKTDANTVETVQKIYDKCLNP